MLENDPRCICFTVISIDSVFEIGKIIGFFKIVQGTGQRKKDGKNVLKAIMAQ